MDIDKVRYYGGLIPLINEWKLIKVTGADAQRFLQGQLTNDVKSLTTNSSQLTCRLSAQGRVKFFFYLAKQDDCFLILVQKELAQGLIAELDKYVIMDDVIFADIPITDLSLILQAKHQYSKFFSIKYAGEQGTVIWNEKIREDEPDLIADSVIASLEFFYGQPNKNIIGKDLLINETRLNDLAISYNKGCFLGQETVAKIQSRKGAAYYPVLMRFSANIPNMNKLIGKDYEIEGKKAGSLESIVEYHGHFYAATRIIRDYRVNHREFSFKFGEDHLKAKILFYPFFEETNSAKAKEIYEKAIDLFHHNDLVAALDLLDRSIAADPQFADAYEAKGVILGRNEQYQQAIDVMDELLRVDHYATMAHTNKSLYLMKLGKIKEAEDEKALAVIKGFERNAKEHEQKNKDSEKALLEEQDLKRKAEMFQKVLEIDSDDDLANFGMAEIYQKRNQFESAIEHLNKVLRANPNYSKAYLLLGTIYCSLGKIQYAREILEQGIQIAAKQGQTKPANEMQMLLAKL